jgi:hypothetical protein
VGTSAAIAVSARPRPAKPAARSLRMANAGAKARARAGNAGTRNRAGGQAPPHHMLKQAPTQKLAPPRSSPRNASPGRERARMTQPGKARAQSGEANSRPNWRSKSRPAAPRASERARRLSEAGPVGGRERGAPWNAGTRAAAPGAARPRVRARGAPPLRRASTPGRPRQAAGT